VIARRRVLVAGLAAVLASPLLAQQQSRVWRIGLLMGRSRPPNLEADYYGAFPTAMRGLGYVEGRNIRYEWRFAAGNMEALAGLASELVRLQVDVIVTGGTAPAHAAHRATKTIPIVMASVGNPLSGGLVTNLARPGGNTTGVTNLNADVSPKLLELLSKTVPKVSRIAVLLNPGNPTSAGIFQGLQSAARGMRIEVTAANARTAEEIQGVFSQAREQGAQALVVVADPYLIQQRRQIAELAVESKLPAIYGLREHVEAGGLMSYGPNRREIYARAATYVDRILKGAKPGELPIEQPTKFELVLNVGAAKALGLKFPPEVTTLADAVIR
jgi:putative tryptophan/tyrosine transport system substrate-binding protein